MNENILEEFGTIQKAQGFIDWLNDFQKRNCEGCKHFGLELEHYGIKSCNFFYQRIRNGICLDRDIATPFKM